MNWLLSTAMFIMIYTFAGYCLQKIVQAAQLFAKTVVRLATHRWRSGDGPRLGGGGQQTHAGMRRLDVVIRSPGLGTFTGV